MTFGDHVPVRRTDVDGVPTLWADLPGPLRSGLWVRVGSADESLPLSGITHLLEHLALFGVGRPGDHLNGFVDQTVTAFLHEGDADTTVGFLDAVTRQLSDPPVHRLSEEREILRAEYAGRPSGVEDALLLWRYGAQGYGVSAFEGLGLGGVDADRLLAWSRAYATRQNAVLWLTGPPPARLHLNLPDGAVMPPPDPRATVVPRTPAYFAGPPGGAGLFAVLTDGYAAQALRHTLQARLVDELRTRRAVAYSPQADYLPLTGTAGRLLISTDLVAGRQSDGVRPLLATLHDLAGTGDGAPVTDQELGEWRADLRRAWDEPQAAHRHLAAEARRLVLGGPPEPAEDVPHLMAVVRPEDVVVAAEAGLRGALAQVPAGVRIARDPWVAAPSSVLEPLDGVVYAELGGPTAHQELVVGTAGLTLRDGGEHLTITRDTAVAVQAWPDGRRAVVAADGNRLVVEPTMWADGHAVVRQIDRLWPGDLVVPMPERPFAEIPVPDVAAPAPAPARVSLWRLLGAVLLFVVMSAWAGALLSAAVMIHHPLPALLALGPGYLAGRAARWSGRGAGRGKRGRAHSRTPVA